MQAVRKSFILLAFLIIFVKLNKAQPYIVIDTIEVKWMTFEQVSTAFANRSKPIFIFLYDSSDSSRIMSDSTLRDKDICNFLNIYFYSIRLDVNSKESITFFDGVTYKPGTGFNGMHGLVEKLAGPAPSFPSFIIFNKEGTGTMYMGGRNKIYMFPVLIYYGEEVNRRVTYDAFVPHFRKVFPEKNNTGYSIVRSVVKWIPLPEALEQQKTNPKKLLIDYYLNERNTSTIMYMSTYNHPDLGKYINENFYPVHFNATSKDTLNVFGGTYPPGTAYPFHELPVAMLQGEMFFPSLLILDEQGKLLDRIQAYLTPELIEPILAFYAQDKHKTTTFAEFLKTFQSKLTPQPK